MSPEKFYDDGLVSSNLRWGGGGYAFVVNLRIYLHPGKSSFRTGLFLFGTIHKKFRKQTLNCFKAGCDKMKLFKIGCPQVYKC
jgi:hypothetical protein